MNTGPEASQFYKCTKRPFTC